LFKSCNEVKWEAEEEGREADLIVCIYNFDDVVKISLGWGN
jgi:hypothetical protein